MATTDKISYGSATAITCTVASLASSSTAGRSCVAIDNQTDLFDDAILAVYLKTSSSALANDKAVYVYFYGSHDGTVFSGSSAEAVGTDVAVTLDNPTNLKGPLVLNCPAVSVTYRLIVPSVASILGGMMPLKWGIVIQNFTGQALDATGGSHTLSYTGIYFQNV